MPPPEALILANPTAGGVLPSPWGVPKWWVASRAAGQGSVTVVCRSLGGALDARGCYLPKLGPAVFIPAGFGALLACPELGCPVSCVRWRLRCFCMESTEHLAVEIVSSVLVVPVSSGVPAGSCPWYPFVALAGIRHRKSSHRRGASVPGQVAGSARPAASVG